MLAYLLKRPMLIREQQLILKQFKFEPEDLIDMWEDIPTSVKSADSNGSTSYQYVIVPRQIEESAIELGVFAITKLTAYGRDWGLSAGQTLDTEVEAAKRRYRLNQHLSRISRISLL